MSLSQVQFISAVGRLGVALTLFHTNVTSFHVMVIMLVMGENRN